MYKILVLSAFALAFTSTGLAQNSAKKEKIKTLFTIMHQDSLMIKTMNAMTMPMMKNLETMLNDTAYKKNGVDVSRLVQQMVEKSQQKSKEIALRLLNEDLVDIYDKYFTIEEINDFTNFYKTKSGQKFLGQMPDISKDIMTVMTTKYQGDLQQSIMQVVEDMRNQITNELDKAKDKN